MRRAMINLTCNSYSLLVCSLFSLRIQTIFLPNAHIDPIGRVYIVESWHLFVLVSCSNGSQKDTEQPFGVVHILLTDPSGGDLRVVPKFQKDEPFGFADFLPASTNTHGT